LLLVGGRGLSPFMLLRQRGSLEPNLRHLYENAPRPVAARRLGPPKTLMADFLIGRSSIQGS
jgi:hypothetical protein